MNHRKSAFCAVAAFALLLTVDASSAAREDAVTIRDAAKAGNGSRLDATLAVLQRAAARRVPQSDVTRRITHKVPVLRASQGYVSVSAYGDDLGGLRSQLISRGLRDARIHGSSV